MKFGLFGGAARGAILPLLERRPASLQIANRSPEKAQALAAEFSAGFGGPTDPRLQTELQKIEVRVGSLPIYGQAP